jgi:hypothetical protein
MKIVKRVANVLIALTWATGALAQEACPAPRCGDVDEWPEIVPR